MAKDKKSCPKTLCCDYKSVFTGGSAFLELFYWYTAAAKLLQSCLTLCDPIDGSPLGSSVPGTLLARILEWVAISFSLKH